MKKKIKKESIFVYLDSDIFRGKLEDVAKKALGIEDLLPQHIREMYTEFELDVSTNYESVEMDLYGYREETDEEYLKRLDSLKKAKEAQKAAKIKKEEQEKEIYERLKKKFENV